VFRGEESRPNHHEKQGFHLCDPEIGFVLRSRVSVLARPESSVPELALFRIPGPVRSDAVRRSSLRPEQIGFVLHSPSSDVLLSAPRLLAIGFVSHGRASVPARPRLSCEAPPRNWLCLARPVMLVGAGFKPARIAVRRSRTEAVLALPSSEDWLCFAYPPPWQLAGFPAFRQPEALRHLCHPALSRISIFRFQICCRHVTYMVYKPYACVKTIPTKE